MQSGAESGKHGQEKITGQGNESYGRQEEGGQHGAGVSMLSGWNNIGGDSKKK